MYPPPVHAAAPFKSHRVCVFWTCCVSLSVMTRRFFLSFNLRSRRVHLVQPNLQQAPRARFHCGVTGRCVVSLPPRELPVVLRKASTRVSHRVTCCAWLLHCGRNSAVLIVLIACCFSCFCGLGNSVSNDLCCATRWMAYPSPPPRGYFRTISQNKSFFLPTKPARAATQN